MPGTGPCEAQPEMRPKTAEEYQTPARLSCQPWGRQYKLVPDIRETLELSHKAGVGTHMGVG